MQATRRTHAHAHERTSSLSSLRMTMLFWHSVSLVLLAPTISGMKLGQLCGHSCLRICNGARETSGRVNAEQQIAINAYRSKGLVPNPTSTETGFKKDDQTPALLVLVLKTSRAACTNRPKDTHLHEDLVELADKRAL